MNSDQTSDQTTGTQIQNSKFANPPVALVCGASKGIGRAVAEKLARQGVNVIALAREQKVLAQLIDQLPRSENQKHKFLCQDLGDLNGLTEKINQVLNDGGPINILVNNCGGPQGGPLLGAKTLELSQAFHNHILAAHVLTQLVAPGMKQFSFGRIINIISTSVKVPIPNLGVSNTVRAAMANWAKTLAEELGQWNITVNNVLPGYTSTDRLQTLIQNVATRENKTIEEIKKSWLNSIPVRRFAKPEEIASAVAFLASKEASYINGINLPVDGGRTGCL
ncbi:MAG: SDR family oxidoreductase [Bdellovibrionales bacterium]|nr:SDR family oxidoreductase [Bdellovibrionales bacterium]